MTLKNIRRKKMKKIKLIKHFLTTFFLTLGLAFVSCSNGSSDDNTFSGEIYIASSFSSDYMNKTLSLIKNFSYTKDSSGSRQKAPDVFIILGSEASGLSDNQVRLAILTSLQGKSLIFDSPKLEDIIQFKTRIDTFLAKEENTTLKAECELSLYNPYNFIDKVVHKKEELNKTSDKELPYDAIATHKNDFYIVYDVDQPFEISKNSSGEEETITWDQSEGLWDEEENVLYNKNTFENYDHLISDSAAKFADWITNSEVLSTAARSLDADAYRVLQDNVKKNSNTSLELQMTAQVERRNFTVVFDHDAEGLYFDGRYNKDNNRRKEIVELVTYIWSVCDIDSQKDYYLVKTSTTCNNQQLGWTNEWGGRYPYSAPHFDYYTISMELMSDKPGYIDEASPQTSKGSTSFTSGITKNYSFTGGFTGTYNGTNGFTGGLALSGTAGISLSESSTTNIPDVSITYTKENNLRCQWDFNTPNVRARDISKTLKKKMAYDGPRPIQIQSAQFDTYTLFSIPSGDDSLDRDHIKLYIKSGVQLKIYVGQYSKHEYKFYNNNYYSKSDTTFEFHVKKPCNTYETYMMGFTPPYPLSAVELDALNSVLKEKCAEPDKALWIGSTSYYGVTGNKDSDEQKKKIMDSIAKNQFTLAKNKILNNKSVFHDAGFRGKYTFYIQKSDTDRQDSFEVDFGN